MHHIQRAVSQARCEVECHKPRSVIPDADAIRQAFDVASATGSGLLRKNEARVAMKALGLELSKHQAEHLMESSANRKEGGAGGIPYAQFEALVISMAAKCDPGRDTVDMFQLFKEDGRPAGRAITVADLQRVNDAGSLGLSAAELQSMIDMVDMDESGDVSLEEFRAALVKRRYLVPTHQEAL